MNITLPATTFSGVKMLGMTQLVNGAIPSWMGRIEVLIKQYKRAKKDYELYKNPGARQRYLKYLKVKEKSRVKAQYISRV
ncbi:hypothetical protein KJ918_01340 [Patescibacteria group bacterium]|nr:hypothetical protein [Patescibacteria group bacterium]